MRSICMAIAARLRRMRLSEVRIAARVFAVARGKAKRTEQSTVHPVPSERPARSNLREGPRCAMGDLTHPPDLTPSPFAASKGRSFGNPQWRNRGGVPPTRAPQAKGKTRRALLSKQSKKHLPVPVTPIDVLERITARSHVVQSAGELDSEGASHASGMARTGQKARPDTASAAYRLGVAVRHDPEPRSCAPLLPATGRRARSLRHVSGP